MQRLIRGRTVALACLTGVTLLVAQLANAGASSASTDRPFADDSPFNLPIGANPALDRQNNAVVELFSTGDHSAALDNYGVPVYEATSTTPRRSIPCTEDWGVCPTAGLVPVPTDATPSLGSDGAMVVIDRSTRTVYEYWQYRGDSTSWSTTTSLDGSGADGGATGAGISRLAGVVRAEEIAAGQIDHALVFSTDVACPDAFRAPATKTDGWNNARSPLCLEEGARLQLDPTIDLDAVPALTNAERAVGKALQIYGAYNIDNGGARMALVMEAPVDGVTAFADSGLSDYQNLDLPWESLRVLAAWDAGTPNTSTPTNPTPTNPDPVEPGSAIDDLAISAAGPLRARLTWSPLTDSHDIVAYRVWRGDRNYANWEFLGENTGDSTSFIDSTLETQHRYTYGVRAVYADGSIGESSNIVRVRVRD